MAFITRMDLGRLAAEDVVFKRKFRWVFAITDGDGTLFGNVVSPSTAPESWGGHFCKVASRPSISMNQQQVQHVIETVFLPAKAEWQPMDITLFDVGTDTSLYKWLRSFYNMEEGRVRPISDPIIDKEGIGSFIKKTGIIWMLDGHGNSMERWAMAGCWPSNIQWGDLSYETSDLAEISFTLRYDRAVNQGPEA